MAVRLFLLTYLIAVVLILLWAVKAFALTGSVVSNLLCIKHYESDCCGGWRAHTGNGYHGGLQMDYTFEKTYGRTFLRRWGHSENWPAWAQLQAGANAVKTRGYNPWPNTRHSCGL